jgi:hypothetical protein
LLRKFAARCSGIDAGGDSRVVLKAAAACYYEIDLRVEGKDFPSISSEAAATFARQIESTLPADFARLLYELEE